MVLRLKRKRLTYIDWWINYFFRAPFAVYTDRKLEITEEFPSTPTSAHSIIQCEL